jgi:hypothetical protein
MSELDELRALVREVIRDVLPKGLPVTETVNLSTDEDLAVFVARLLDADAQTREDLRTGRKRFRLGVTLVPSAPSITPPSAATESIPTSEDHGAHVAPGANGRTAVNGSAGSPAGRTAEPQDGRTAEPQDGRTAEPQAGHSAGPPVPVRRVERGAVTERMVRDAAKARERLVLGRAAVLTPLARDRARSSGVEIEKER